MNFKITALYCVPGIGAWVLAHSLAKVRACMRVCVCVCEWVGKALCEPAARVRNSACAHDSGCRAFALVPCPQRGRPLAAFLAAFALVHAVLWAPFCLAQPECGEGVGRGALRPWGCDFVCARAPRFYFVSVLLAPVCCSVPPSHSMRHSM